MADKIKEERINELAESKPLPRNVLDLLVANALGFMIAGFVILMVAAVTFTFVVHQPGIFRTIALWAGFSGFGVYMVGRICLSIKRRRQSPQTPAKPGAPDEDDE